MNRPDPSEYARYYDRYVSLVPDGDIVEALGDQNEELRSMIAALPEEKGTYAYADGKWSIKQLLSHIIDGERVFAYRVLRISRGDETPIEGFEQDPYIEHSHADQRTFADLAEEFSLCRSSNILMLRNLQEEDWHRVGTANEDRISARALAWIMAGHVIHHISVLEERYLK